jgi:sugar lactone lactonase YvrE
MYFADSLDHMVRAWDYDPSSGLPGASRPLAGCTPPAFPDGACVDEEGGLWSARFQGGCIVRYHPSGSVDRVITLPVRRPTSCAFGGPDLRTLFVTTTCQKMSPTERQAEPLAGALLALDVGCRGLPEPRFSLRGLEVPTCAARPDASGAHGARDALGTARTLHQP